MATYGNSSFLFQRQKKINYLEYNLSILPQTYIVLKQVQIDFCVSYSIRYCGVQMMCTSCGRQIRCEIGLIVFGKLP
jgi:hypothetical protein